MKENEEVYHRHRTAGKRLPRACERRTVRPGDETSSRPEGGDSYSVGMGLLMAVVFSAAAAYLGLKVGQVFEAAIPIAIIAVGLSNALKKKKFPRAECDHPVDRLLFGSDSGRLAIFTLPGSVYPSGYLSRHHGGILSDIPQFAVGRNPGHSLLHTLP